LGTSVAIPHWISRDETALSLQAFEAG
jgi:hypothetical protein